MSKDIAKQSLCERTRGSRLNEHTADYINIGVKSRSCLKIALATVILLFLVASLASAYVSIDDFKITDNTNGYTQNIFYQPTIYINPQHEYNAYLQLTNTDSDHIQSEIMVSCWLEWYGIPLYYYNYRGTLVLEPYETKTITKDMKLNPEWISYLSYLGAFTLKTKVYADNTFAFEYSKEVRICNAC